MEKNKVNKKFKKININLIKSHQKPNQNLLLKASKKSIYKVIYIFIGLFTLMMGYFTYFLVAKSDEVINSTYNTRQQILVKKVVRGEIMSADDQVLAKTVTDKDGNETRKYPYGDIYAHVVGRLLNGRSGLEETENIRLLTSNVNTVEKIKNDMSGEKSIGDNVVTTLDSKLQKAAYDALGNYRGAVVVMESATGKVLAMVSKPAYDPNKIESLWDEIVKDKGNKSTLLNRATQGRYPPGSTFKTLTALEYIRENPSYKSYKYNCNGSIEYDGMVIHCYGNEKHGNMDLPLSYAKSCNTSFASIGKTLNPRSFHDLCEDFLFNTSLKVEMTSKQSSFTLDKGNSSVKEAMQTAIGQGKTLITPLHNALIASTVANGGVMMKPYVVDYIENAEKGTVEKYLPKKMAAPMTSEEADYIGMMMRKVVTDGTGKKLKDLKVKAAGKTGSADQNKGKAHAWFIGYAPYDKPQIAISVIVENAGTGGSYAVPIAKKVINAYFNSGNR
jgi:peptidoglycan glycosyltransferase